MPSYLVETYAANRVEAIEDMRERAHVAAELGASVRYVRTTFLPGDEDVLPMFEAHSAEALRRAARLAGLEHERIVEAVERTGRRVSARRIRFLVASLALITAIAVAPSAAADVPVC